MARVLNVGIVGYKFMGKAHSNAYHKAPRFFDLACVPALKVACGRHEQGLRDFARKWGWQETETSWESLIARGDVDIVDISSPTHMHKDVVGGGAAGVRTVRAHRPARVARQR